MSPARCCAYQRPRASPRIAWSISWRTRCSRSQDAQKVELQLRSRVLALLDSKLLDLGIERRALQAEPFRRSSASADVSLCLAQGAKDVFALIGSQIGDPRGPRLLNRFQFRPWG